MSEGAQSTQIAAVFRECSGRAVATLARRFGDLGLAEEMVQEAFLVALERWPIDGVPPSPVGWILTTARRAAIDRVRRESTRSARHEESFALYGPEEPPSPEDGPVIEDQLRLMFTCCHPALAPTAQVALTLRLIGGLETREIARAFLVPEATMAQRLVRAKNKIRDAHIPYRVPSEEEMPERLRPVLATLYLVFNEGYLASSGDALVRAELSGEGIRLARHTAELLPNEPEVAGLLALMLLLESRRAARTAPDGALVRLADQDRSRWDRAMIERGHALVRECLRGNQPGPYQIQAAIQAVHADAPRAQDTDWSQIVQLYDHLMTLLPTAVVALNRAIAIAELGRVAEALALVDALPLDEYHLFHATRAELLGRLARHREAETALDQALERVTNEVERRALVARRDEARARIASTPAH